MGRMYLMLQRVREVVQSDAATTRRDTDPMAADVGVPRMREIECRVDVVWLACDGRLLRRTLGPRLAAKLPKPIDHTINPYHLLFCRPSHPYKHVDRQAVGHSTRIFAINLGPTRHSSVILSAPSNPAASSRLIVIKTTRYSSISVDIAEQPFESHFAHKPTPVCTSLVVPPKCFDIFLDLYDRLPLGCYQMPST